MSYWRNMNSAPRGERRGSRDGDRELLATLRHHSQRSDVRSGSSDLSREGYRDREGERERRRDRLGEHRDFLSREVYPLSSRNRSRSRESRNYTSPDPSNRTSTPRNDYISTSRSHSRERRDYHPREYSHRDYVTSSRSYSRDRGRDRSDYRDDFTSLRTRSPSRERSPQRDFTPSSTRSRSRDVERIPTTTRSLSRESSREGAWQQRYLSSRYSHDRERERARTFETQNVQKLLEVLKKEKDRNSQLADERESLRDSRSECSLAEVMTQRTVRSVRSRDTRGTDSLTPRSVRAGGDHGQVVSSTVSPRETVTSRKTNKGSSTSGMDGVSADELERLRKRNEEWVKDKMKQKRDDDSTSATLSRRLSTGSSTSAGRMPLVRRYSETSQGGIPPPPTAIPAPRLTDDEGDWSTPLRNEEEEKLTDLNPAHTFPQEVVEQIDDEKNTSIQDAPLEVNLPSDESASFNNIVEGEFERRMSSMNINVCIISLE